jgi:hypothetical protein
MPETILPSPPGRRRSTRRPRISHGVLKRRVPIPRPGAMPGRETGMVVRGQAPEGMRGLPSTRHVILHMVLEECRDTRGIPDETPPGPASRRLGPICLRPDPSLPGARTAEPGGPSTDRGSSSESIAHPSGPGAHRSSVICSRPAWLHFLDNEFHPQAGQGSSRTVDNPPVVLSSTLRPPDANRLPRVRDPSRTYRQSIVRFAENSQYLLAAQGSRARAHKNPQR